MFPFRVIPKSKVGKFVFIKPLEDELMYRPMKRAVSSPRLTLSYSLLSLKDGIGSNLVK